MSVNNPKCPENQSTNSRKFECRALRLSTRITRLPIVTNNDYRHFATGPYSRGEDAWTVICILRRKLPMSQKYSFCTRDYFLTIFLQECHSTSNTPMLWKHWITSSWWTGCCHNAGIVLCDNLNLVYCMVYNRLFGRSFLAKRIWWLMIMLAFLSRH